MYYRIFLTIMLLGHLSAQSEVFFTARPTKLVKPERVALELIEKLHDYQGKYQKYLEDNESPNKETWHQEHQTELQGMIVLLKQEPDWNIVGDDALLVLINVMVDVICNAHPFYDEFIQQVIHSGVLYNERIRESILRNVDACGIRKLMHHGLRLTEDDDYVMVKAALVADGEFIKALLSAGGNPNASSHAGSALMFAAGRNNLSIVKALTDRLEAIDEKHHVFNGQTALHYAFCNILENLNREYMLDKHIIIELLISKGCAINARDNEGATPLIHAIKVHDSYDVEPDQRLIDLIVSSGADLLINDHRGLSALHYASHKGLKKLIQALMVALEKYQPEKVESARAHVHFDMSYIIQKNAFYDDLKRSAYSIFDVVRNVMVVAGIFHAAHALNNKYKLVGRRL
jgi:hypothetical protein